MGYGNVIHSLSTLIRSTSVLTLVLLGLVAYSVLCVVTVVAANAIFGVLGIVVSVIGLFLLGSALAERYL